MRMLPAILGLLSSLPVPTLAETMIEANISMIRTGWNGDYFAVVTLEAVKNPGNCKTPDGYVSEKSAPGYNTYYAAALTAFSLRAPVSITISSTECVLDRPKLVGINIRH